MKIEWTARRIPSAAYRLCYVAGIQTVRLFHRAVRRLRRITVPVGRFFRRNMLVEIRKELAKQRGELKMLHQRAQEAHRRWKETENARNLRDERLRAAQMNRNYVVRVLQILMNFLLPAAAVLVFLATLRVITQKSYCLELSCGGTVIGYVQNENIVREAEAMVAERTGEKPEKAPVQTTMRLTERTQEVNCLSGSLLCNEILRKSSANIASATGVYVNGSFCFAVESQLDLRYILQSVLNASNDAQTLSVEFDDDIALEEGIYSRGIILASAAAQKYLTGSRRSVRTYITSENETPESIAGSFDMTVAQLHELNPDVPFSEALQAGTRLMVSTVSSVLSVRRTVQETYTESLPYETVRVRSSSVYLGYSKVANEGENGTAEYVDAVTYVNGCETARKNISTTAIQPATARVIYIGTRLRSATYFYLSPDSAAGDYGWPVPASRLIWQGYSGYHDAIDISAAYGTAITAAQEGVVISAGWHYGYGNNLTIRHANGDTSFYGHCSSLLVSVGDTVSKGQVIARVGNTGIWSQGNHLHFEIRVSGRTVNPLNYISE